MRDRLEKLIGKKIKRIFFNEDFLKFETDQENIVYFVDGDCCSRSIFYDFIGVKKLLLNGSIIEVESIDLEPTDIVEGSYGVKDKKSEDDDIKVYGYRLTTEDSIWGKVSSVFSFRNYSNGYYGGSLEDAPPDTEVQPEIFDDVLESSPVNRHT